MTKLIAAAFAVLCASPSAFAITSDPFDVFVGSYVVEGLPRVRSFRSRMCNLYQFEKLKALNIEIGSAPNETHMIKFVSAYRESKHSVQNYDRRNDKDSAGAFAATFGAEGWAYNVRGTWSTGNKNNERVYFERTQRGVRVQMQEEAFRAGVLQAACYYEADLVPASPAN
ncbi:MAG: hypothetical protein J7501_05830 [Bdellovibrio sp.]|nr:hypothetical protein [Bdellovibrio sp.]